MRDATAPRSASFASLVQQFFTEYLVSQRALRPCTVASYRDAFMLFLDFAHKHLGKAPTALQLADIEPDLILAFLDHLEQQRHNTVRSRNLRLTALRAFLKFAARRDVSSLHVIERALGVPMKRFERPMLGFMSLEEMLAVMGQPGSTWTSQRDHLLLTMLYNTGARVSEIIGVRVADVVQQGIPCVHLLGKGRKKRSVPLWKTTAQKVRAWLRCNPTLGPEDALLPNREGRAMTRSNVTQRLDIAVARAAEVHSSLTTRSISPHTIRRYLPFLTMSGNLGALGDLTGDGERKRASPDSATRHSPLSFTDRLERPVADRRVGIFPVCPAGVSSWLVPAPSWPALHPDRFAWFQRFHVRATMRSQSARRTPSPVRGVGRSPDYLYQTSQIRQ